MNNRSEKGQVFVYLIRVQGYLDAEWSDWFDGFKIEYTVGSTTLRGTVPDQAALHGILAKIRDLGLTILLVANLTEVQLE